MLQAPGFMVQEKPWNLELVTCNELKQNLQ